jgi:SAM-dependent methyltransferase
LLTQKLSGRGIANVDVRPGFFDAIPMADASADLVVSCSSFTADPAHGGQAGLDEMHRVAAPGGMIVLVWPSDVDWLRERGFRYESFDGEMCIDFGSLDEAVRLAQIVYPWAVDGIVAHGSGCVPYEVIGMNAPRDLAWKGA